MANAFRAADALGIYLTSAPSDGGIQSDPDASLGGFRSSTQVSDLGGIVNNATPPLIFEHISGANAEGVASVRTDANGRAYFTAPGGSEGAGVAVADAETKWVPETNGNKGVRIRRDGASLPIGIMTLDLVNPYNGLLGMGNVPNADRIAGEDYYRAGMLYAHGPFGVLDIVLWFTATGAQATFQIGLETPAGDKSIQTIANEHTAPAAVGFSTPLTKGAGLTIPLIDIGEVHGLWIHRDFPAAGNVATEETITLNIAYWGA